MPKDIFVCLGCKKRSQLGEVHELERAPYVVCVLCGTKNKVLRLKTFLGGAAEYAVIGIRLDDDR